jgi:hypothetical protein
MGAALSRLGPAECRTRPTWLQTSAGSGKLLDGGFA